MRLLTIILAIFLGVSGSGKADREMVRSCKRIEKSIAKAKCKLGDEPVNVLCIGNSLTFHGRYDKIGWYSAHGMAASKMENDYVHVLESMFKEQNPDSKVTSTNAGSWELDFSKELEPLLGEKCKGKDIIVIRLGENVQEPAMEDYERELTKFIEFCKGYAPKVVITGVFETNMAKEAIIRKCAEKTGIGYAPLYWIWELHRDECTPKVGDTLYDTDGNPYQIGTTIYLTHPNDLGMKKIAQSIFSLM